MAQYDSECLALYNHLSNYPLMGPKAELAEIWGQYVEQTVLIDERRRENPFQPVGGFLNETSLLSYLAKINSIRHKLDE